MATNKATTTKHRHTTAAAELPPNPSSGAREMRADDGYRDAEEQLEIHGYWQPEKGALHGVLLSGFRMTQKSGRGKGGLRTIYVFRLLEPLAEANVWGETANGQKALEPGALERGAQCAVFGGPGLRALENLAGCMVKLERLPEKKELPNGNSMWLYKIRYRGERKALHIRNPFGESHKNREIPDDVDLDGVPF